jgi:hypothetical protein
MYLFVGSKSMPASSKQSMGGQTRQSVKGDVMKGPVSWVGGQTILTETEGWALCPQA